MNDQKDDTAAYLAKIRKTIAESEKLIEQSELRMQETDRFLASQGLTREQVMNFRFSEEQKQAVNRELARQGLPPIEDDPADAAPQSSFDDYRRLPDDGGEDIDRRKQKFGMMMKPFMI